MFKKGAHKNVCAHGNQFMKGQTQSHERIDGETIAIKIPCASNAQTFATTCTVCALSFFILMV